MKIYDMVISDLTYSYMTLYGQISPFLLFAHYMTISISANLIIYENFFLGSTSGKEGMTFRHVT